MSNDCGSYYHWQYLQWLENNNFFQLLFQGEPVVPVRSTKRVTLTLSRLIFQFTPTTGRQMCLIESAISQTVWTLLNRAACATTSWTPRSSAWNIAPNTRILIAQPASRPISIKVCVRQTMFSGWTCPTKCIIVIESFSSFNVLFLLFYKYLF